ncbi:MAG: 30S ribosomal protein S4, partial [Methanolinea sp.]
AHRLLDRPEEPGRVVDLEQKTVARAGLEVQTTPHRIREGLGLLGPDAGIDDVLSLRVENELERRLQTLVYRKCLARSPKQARQMITHGHIAIAGKRVSIPGYRVTRAEESEIGYYARSPVANPDHAERARIARAGR